MATSRELYLSILALDAYNRGYNAATIVGGDHVGQALLTSQVYSSQQVAAGFYATSYNVSDVPTFSAQTTVISYRGTDDPLGSLSGGDLVNGWTIGAGFASASQSGLALQFYADAVGQNVFQGPMPNVVLTGHSLGGGLAGMVGALSGDDVTIFDPMPFIISTALTYVSEVAHRIVSLELPPSLPTYSGIDAIYVMGEALQYGRDLGPTLELAALTAINPLIGLGLSTYDFGAELAINYRALDPHGFFLRPVDLHSQNLLVLLEYAHENNLTEWSGIAASLLHALFNPELGKALSLEGSNALHPLGVTGTAPEDAQMRSMIAYSAIDEGYQPFGDKAIVSLFNDADDLGRLYSTTMGNSALSGAAVQNALSEIIVQYAGDLAKYAGDHPGLYQDPYWANGIITLDSLHFTMSIDLDPAKWAATTSHPDFSIVGKQDLVDALLGLPAGISVGGTRGITMIIAETGQGPAVLDASSAPLALDHHAGGGLLIGGVSSDQLLGGAGNDILFGGAQGDSLKGGAGNDTIYGGDGTDTAVFTYALGSQIAPGQFDGFYDLERHGTTVTVRLASSSGVETDTLSSVEYLQFSDKTINILDLPDLSSQTTTGGRATDGGTAAIAAAVSGHEASTGGASAAETIVGNDTSQYLGGTSGPDHILGLGGDDVLTGYGGQDSFDGGLGSDTVDYSYELSDVSGTITLGNGNGTAEFPGYYTEQLISIENVWMGAGNDTVVGDAGDNDLRGGPGNDTLTGGLGNDHIYGDWKYSDQGGFDTAVVSYTFGSSYTVSGSASALHIVGVEGDDWYYNVENFLFAGGVIATATQLLAAASFTGPASIALVSVANDGAHANNASYVLSMSGNGQYIVFESVASNLVPGDTNALGDIFIYDVVAHNIERITNNSNNSFAVFPPNTDQRISDDGRYIVMLRGENIIVHDRQAGADETLVIVNPSNGPGVVGISGNGQFITYADNYELWIHNRIDNSNKLISDNSTGFNAISRDGHFIAYHSRNSLTGEPPSIIIYDQVLHSYERIPYPGSGGPIFINADGRYVEFASSASDLVSGDTNGYADVFVYDRNTGSIERVSVASDGQQGNAGSTGSPGMSADGRYVTFGSAATNLVSGDNNNLPDVFVYDQVTHLTELVSRGNNGQLGFGFYGSGSPFISGDGRFVAFPSDASNLVPFDNNNTTDIFVVDRRPNYMPVAHDDVASTTEALTVICNVLLGNGQGVDSDPDGDALTIVAVNGLSDNLGHPFTLASGAQLAVNPDGRFAYDAHDAFNSLGLGQTTTDSFTYTISDGQGHTDTATVTVTIKGIEHGAMISGGTGTITGTAVNDQLAGGDSGVTIYGLGGYDWLQGGAGADALDGGDNSDILDGGGGVDFLNGGFGDDSLTGGADSDILLGGNGNDTLSGGAGGDVLDGGLDFDTASFANSGFVQIYLTAPSFNGGDAAGDTFTSIEVYTLSAVGDNFYGDNNNDTVSSDGGADIVFTYAGNDLIDAGAGNDYVVSGEGNDTISGGEGADIIAGLGGDDVINGGNNDAGTVDQLYGYDGNDTLNGDGSGDLLFGMAGNDTLNGGDGTDYLYGQEGDDALNGGAAYDLLQGGDGNDILFGGDDPGVVNGLFGQGGNDTLIGGTGIDYMWGGDGAVDTGNDVFEIHAGGSVDVILDFQAGVGIGDVLHLVGTGNTSFAQMQSAGQFVQIGSYAGIVMSAGNVVYLANVNVVTLVADDFQFS